MNFVAPSSPMITSDFSSQPCSVADCRSVDSAGAFPFGCSMKKTYSPSNVSIWEAPRTTSHPNVSPPPVLYSVPKADTFIWQQSLSTPFAVGRSRATFRARFFTASSSVEGRQPVCHVSACSALKLTCANSFIPSSNVLNFFANFISTSPFINFYEWGGFICVPFDINPTLVLLKDDNVFV